MFRSAALKTVKVGFASSWTKLDPYGDVKTTLLSFLGKYNVQQVPPMEADYFFFSVFNGLHHAEAGEHAVKILLTGENYCPDFNACDYAMSFEYLDYGDRHLRLPLYMLYSNVDALKDRSPLTMEDLRARKNFCSFIFSNGKADPFRDRFFGELNKRIPVHSAGRHLANTQSVDLSHPELSPNLRKRRYMEDFRFSLSFENSSHPGYVTEKIADAFIARTIPVYWGDPCIGEEFNEDAFINARAFRDMTSAIDFIQALNSDESRMLAMLNAPPLKKPDQIENYWRRLGAFLDNIFDQGTVAARRMPQYGFAGNLQRKRRKDCKGFKGLLKTNRV